jgi:ribonuclease HI
MLLEVWTDGTSKPKLISKKNKSKDGPSASAVVIKNDNKIIYSNAKYTGLLDNNQAEYEAFIEAVKFIVDVKAAKVKFYTDSNMIEKQMTNQYNSYSEAIIPYYLKAKELLSNVPQWEIKLIPRSENHLADRLADEAIKNWMTENVIQ